MVISATLTDLSLTALRWHSVAVDLRTLPECQYQPLFIEEEKKRSQMPLALGAGTLTNYHSHCHGNENLETVNAFQALNLPPLSSQTGCSSRPPTSSTRELGWKMLHQKSSQALSLLPRSRCHPVKCIGVF